MQCSFCCVLISYYLDVNVRWSMTSWIDGSRLQSNVRHQTLLCAHLRCLRWQWLIDGAVNVIRTPCSSAIFSCENVLIINWKFQIGRMRLFVTFSTDIWGMWYTYICLYKRFNEFVYWKSPLLLLRLHCFTRDALNFGMLLSRTYNTTICRHLGGLLWIHVLMKG